MRRVRAAEERHESGVGLPPTQPSSSHLTLVLLCLAQFMLIVDVVIVNVALPEIRTDLALPDSRLQLVAVGYTLTFGSLLVVFGRAGDLFGRRRIFLTGLVVFTIASLATGLAQTEWQLLSSRAAQGLGAAMVSPTALALLTTAFAEGPDRNRALGYWGAVGSAGAIAGQLLGGLLTDIVGWRAIFLINVPIGLVAFVGAARSLRESHADDQTRLDIRGAALLVAGLSGAIVALTLFAERHHLDYAIGAALVALSALILFVRQERRHPTPLVDSALVRRTHIVHANLLLAVNAGMLGGALFFTTLYLQVVLGYSPLAVGAAFAPITLLILVLSPSAGTLTTKYGARRMLTVGFPILAAGMLLLARLPDNGRYVRDVLPPLVLLALGSAISYAPTFIAGTSGIEERQQGLASGLLNSAQELGAAIGVTTLGSVAVATTARHADRSLVAGYRVGLVVAATAIAISVALVRRLPRVTEATDVSRQPEPRERDFDVTADLRTGRVSPTDGGYR